MTGLCRWRLMVALVFLVLSLLPVGQVLAANKAVVRDVVVVNSDEDLLLYFTLDGAISEEMEQGIGSGIPVTFAFYVELYQHEMGKLIQVASRNFQHTIRFETLKALYLLEQTEHNRQDIERSSFSEASQVMLSVHDLPLSSLALMKPGATYTVKVKAELAKQGLPEKFKNVMTFVKIWDFETPWTELKFTMLPTPPVGE